MKTKYYHSFEEFNNDLMMGHEINFTLFGKDYYFGAPEEKLVLSGNNQDIYFETLDDFYNFKIENKSIKDLWMEIDIDTIW